MPHKQFLLRMHGRASWQTRNVYNRDRDIIKIILFVVGEIRTTYFKVKPPLNLILEKL
jgi:rRNA processing protein Gar1